MKNTSRCVILILIIVLYYKFLSHDFSFYWDQELESFVKQYIYRIASRDINTQSISIPCRGIKAESSAGKKMRLEVDKGGVFPISSKPKPVNLSLDNEPVLEYNEIFKTTEFSANFKRPESILKQLIIRVVGELGSSLNNSADCANLRRNIFADSVNEQLYLLSRIIHHTNVTLVNPHDHSIGDKFGFEFIPEICVIESYGQTVVEVCLQKLLTLCDIGKYGDNRMQTDTSNSSKVVKQPMYGPSCYFTSSNECAEIDAILFKKS